MNNKKRISTLIIATFLVANLFSGCSSDGGDPSSQQTGGTSTAGTVSGGGDAEESNYNAPGELPIVKEQVELDVYFGTGATIIMEDNEWVKWVEESTNVKLNIEAVLEADALSKLNLKLNNPNETPDVINIPMGDGSTVSAYAAQNLLVNYKDYWDRLVNMPKIEEELPVNMSLLTSSDGGIYTSLQYLIGYHTQYSSKLWINQAWLNNVGKELPTTTDELKDVLQAFKDEDANGNGDTSDEIPLVSAAAGGWRTDPMSFLLSPFAKTGAPGFLYLFEDTDEKMIKSGVFEDGFDDGLAYMNELYEAGLLDQETFAQKNSVYQGLAQAENGTRIGSVTSGGISAFNSPTDEYSNGEYVVVPPLEGPDGVTRTQYYVARFTPRWQVTTACPEENREAAVRVADFLLADYFSDDPKDLEIALSNSEGPYGYTLYTEEDGKSSVSGEVGYFERTYDFGDATNLNVANSRPAFGSYDFKKLMVTDLDVYNDEAILWAATDLYAASDELIISTLPFVVSAENATEYAELKVQISSFLSQEIAAFVTGSRDLSEWEDFLQELNDIGMERYMEISNEAYKNQQMN